MNIFWHWINLAGDTLPLFYNFAGRAPRSHPFLVFVQNVTAEYICFLMGSVIIYTKVNVRCTGWCILPDSRAILQRTHTVYHIHQLIHQLSHYKALMNISDRERIP